MTLQRLEASKFGATKLGPEMLSKVFGGKTFHSGAGGQGGTDREECYMSGKTSSQYDIKTFENGTLISDKTYDTLPKGYSKSDFGPDQ